MKKLINSLAKALNLPLMLLVIFTVSMSSCKKESPSNPQTDYCPNLPGIQSSAADCPPIIPTPAPTGTATAVSTSISYDTVATFKYSFENTDAVYFNNVYAGVDSGTWRSGRLRGDSGFQVTAHGKNGTTLVLPNKIQISVAMDPRIVEVATGIHKLDTLWARPIDSPNVAYRVVPFGCASDTYTFTWSGLTGMPGNPMTTVSCATGTVQSGWFFTGEDGFYWHGIWHDQFSLTYNANGGVTGFKIRDANLLYQWNPGGPFVPCYRIQKFKH